jgi:cytochrome c oxidase subunit 2
MGIVGDGMRRIRSWRALGALLPLVALLLAACGNETGPQDIFNPAGPPAETIKRLFVPVLVVAGVVFVLVEGLLVVTIIRWRHRKRSDRMPTQVHGNSKLEIGWTIAPAVLLGVIAIPTLGTIFSMARAPTGPDVLRVNVTAHQFWWQAEYPGLNVNTANVIHIPVGQPVYVRLESVDVIHSFWVPRLAGKQDVVPGNTNYLTIEASEPGTYSAQCAEFCGLSHANMRFRVEAQTPTEFQAWAAANAQPLAAPPPKEVLDIMNRAGCGGCHTINGLENFVGTLGPNLTHFAGRQCFAGCYLENTPQNLSEWLTDPPAVKPGVDMPNLHLTAQDVQILVNYLESLQ